MCLMNGDSLLSLFVQLAWQRTSLGLATDVEEKAQNLITCAKEATKGIHGIATYPVG